MPKPLSILGVTHPMHLNSGACLLLDGKLVAFAEEERFSRLKHSPGNPANQAIQYCLEAGKLSLDEVDAIALGLDYNINPLGWDRLAHPKIYYEQRALMDQLPFRRDDRRLRFVNHHVSHSLSAYYMSGFKEAICITLDGTGGGEAGTLAVGRGDDFEVLERIPNDSSWGHFYTLITQKIGFQAHSAEGKTMGLAAYGAPDPHFFDACIDWDRPFPMIDREARRKLLAKIPARKAGEPLTQQHKDLAASLQLALERAGAQMAKFLHDKTGIRNLTMGGGCALNCSMNGKLRRLPFIDHIYVQPAAHDSSTALGAAAKTHRDVTGHRPDFVMEHAYWGPEFTNEQIESTLKRTGYARYRKSSDVAKEAAQLLVDGKVLGWFQGRMEVGPRALGGRSILGNPGDPGMKDRINKQVKGREPWRPFAPSFLEEEAAAYVTSPYPSPFMIVAFDSKPENRDRIVSATHVDGTVRVQTVSRKHNPPYWSLLNEMKKSTGVGAVLNTSFNIAGEPVVCTPLDAVRTFFSCGMDAVAIGDFIVEK